MLTVADKKWFSAKFATKLDFKLLATKKELTRLEVNLAVANEKIGRIEKGYERMDGKIDKVLSIVDGFAGKVADLEDENKMGAITLRRHDAQIHELARAIGTTISE